MGDLGWRGGGDGEGERKGPGGGDGAGERMGPGGGEGAGERKGAGDKGRGGPVVRGRGLILMLGSWGRENLGLFPRKGGRTMPGWGETFWVGL